MVPWGSVPVIYVPLVGLVFTTEHDWHPEVALVATVTARSGKQARPIHLLAHDGRLHVSDGRHRVVGFLLAGRGLIPAKVQIGHDETCPCAALPGDLGFR
jgi:hypothetical protein